MKRTNTLMHWMLLAVVALAAGATSCHAHAQELPSPKGYMNDFARLLSEDEAVKLEVELAKYDARTGIQIAVVTVKSLDGYSVEDYTRNLSNAWGVGKKGNNNGVMFLVAPTERKIRIAVGDGLTAQLSDSTAKNIIDETVAPQFRKNRLSDGITMGARSIMQTLDAARVEREPVATKTKSPDFGELAMVVGVIFSGLLIARIIIRASIARSERKDNRESTLSLLEELPKRLNEARRALGHPDVSEKTHELLESAFKEFEKEKTAARMAPELYHSASSLRHVQSTVNVALENAAHEKKLAEKARTEGPELLAKLPELLAAAKEKAAGDKQSQKRIVEAERQYNEARAHAGSGSIIDWIIVYALVSSAFSHCENVISPTPTRSRDSDGERTSSGSGEGVSVLNFGGGSMGDGGASGSW